MATLDGPAFFYLFWGAIKAGIVPVPLNTLLRAADYAYFIEDSECAAIAFSPELAVEIEAALGGARHRPHVVLRTSGEGPSLSAVMGAAASELEPAAAGSEDDCYWLYSSGSTGRPKGVVHSHRTLALTGQHYAVETLGAAADDVFFSAAKLFFSYGLGNAMSFPLWTGGTSILMPDRPTPESTFAAIERFRPTLFFGVPTSLLASSPNCRNGVRIVFGARLRFGRRSAAGAHSRNLASTDRDRHPRRRRLDRGGPHLHRKPPGRCDARSQR